DLDVIANQSNPDTLTTGGVAEFDGIPNPVVALQGSGTADAPYLIFYLNTTGVGSNYINVSYNVRDIDGSSDNAVQQVALQYRIGNTGNFINLPKGYIGDATTGPNQATLVTPVSVTLPAAARNQPQVQVRVITSNAPGSDEWVGIDDINITTTTTPPRNKTNVDFNGDGRSDWVVTRNISGLLYWFIQPTGATSGTVIQFGLGTDKPVPADYDGDGILDIAVWRETGNPEPNRAYFYILRSSTNTFQAVMFGTTGDDPSVVGDYDGDGKDDVAVFRPNSNEPCGANKSVWFYRPSSQNVDFLYSCWGLPGDRPYPADFNADGRNDFAVFRNEGGNGVFYVLRTDGATGVFQWGLGTDTLVPGDYDGDARTDLCVRRTISGVDFYFILLGGLSTQATFQWGSSSAGDISVPGDYDGDGATDIAIWRPNPDPTQNFFFVRRSSNGTLLAFEWGQQGDGLPASFQVK
ncbi:MAG: VCBS repeat-containing protein, partial [Acidobacteriota bacterium]|nr:VCBS repeat-containing protein [Acidobacteriota bacterium]